MNRIRHQRLIDQVPALFVFLIVGAVLAGCASSAGARTASASPAHSPALAAGTPATARTFTSRHYGYSETLPPGWASAAQAKQQWDGKGAPGAEDSVVDLFRGPGGVEAWVYAAPTKENLAAYAIRTVRVAGVVHSCPRVPQTNQAITISGTPARLLDTQCPARSGFLVELVVTIRHGIGFVIGSQNPSGTTPTDRPAFRKFLAGITFPG